jgi:hypothetical protein
MAISETEDTPDRRNGPAEVALWSRGEMARRGGLTLRERLWDAYGAPIVIGSGADVPASPVP